MEMEPVVSTMPVAHVAPTGAERLIGGGNDRDRGRSVGVAVAEERGPSHSLFSELLERQSNQGQRVEALLERSVHSVDDVRESLSSLGETLSVVRQHLADDAVAQRKLHEVIAQIPRVADAQREAMVTLTRQHERLHEQSEQQYRALGSLNDAIARQQTTIEGILALLREGHQVAELRADRTARLMEKQTGRMTVFGVWIVVLAFSALVLGVIAVCV